MLDRTLKLIITLTLLFFLLQAVIGLLCRMVSAVLTGVTAGLGHAASFVGSLIAVVLMTCFLVGLLVRGARFVSTRDPRMARERTARERAVRQRVRRPAEGVPPVESRAEVLDDPDPAIGEEERG